VSVTDRQLLADLQRLTLEPTVDDGLTWAGNFWTLSEILGYSNQRQQRFIADTCLVGGHYAFNTNPQEVQVFDDEVVFIHHAIYEDNLGVCAPVDPIGRTSADLAIPAWQTSTDRPLGYLLEQTGTLQLSLVPPPTTAGRLHLFCVVLADVLDRTGVYLNIPDEWTPYLLFGVLAEMFGKPGSAQDEPRRAYCEERYEEGVQAARAVVGAVMLG
jgi:hypothetical protein